MTPFNLERTKALVREFSELMLSRMIDHQDKGDWSDKPLISFFPRFLSLSADLFQAFVKNDFTAVGEKCVHLGNYCMMLASRVGYIVPVNFDDPDAYSE